MPGGNCRIISMRFRLMFSQRNECVSASRGDGFFISLVDRYWLIGLSVLEGELLEISSLLFWILDKIDPGGIRMVVFVDQDDFERRGIPDAVGRERDG